MEGFTYHNIFETKGIEYIVIIGFLILIIPFWFIINKKNPVVKRIQNTISSISARLLRIPAGLLFGKNHMWAFMGSDGKAKIGVDDFLVQVVGEFDIVPLKSIGEHVKAGEKLAIVKRKGKQLNLTSPVSGEILDVNASVFESSEMISDDPFKTGWLFSVKPNNWKIEMNRGMIGDEAVSWFGQEVDRFKDFLAVSLKKNTPDASLVALQEGGEIRSKVLAELDNDIWRDFENEFLQ
ncbi:MAG: hypothetical protein KDC05_00115 [Bacteroidales bacterium]|nr:hypothetical protein [Bacteroidales bacterium]